MMLKKISAFVMADSVLALAVISLGISSLLICQQQLNHLQAKHLVKLNAARLAKETSDEYYISGQKTVQRRNDYRAVASSNQVTVYYQNRPVLRVS